MSRATPASRGAVDRFSTRGLPAARRIELWEEHNADALVALQCRMFEDDSALEASEANLQLDRLHLAHVEANPHAVERTARTVRTRPTESVALYFTLRGEAFFYHDDGVRMLRPGQLLVCDADRPFLRGFSQGLEELAVKVPYDVFRAAGGTMPRTAQVIEFGTPSPSGGNAHAAALAELVARAVGPDGDGAADEDAVLDLVTAVLVRPLGSGAQAAGAHFAAAERYVRRWLRDPTMSARRIADAIGLSERQLSRVLAEHGTSVPRLVARRRVEMASRMLRMPSYAEQTVEAIGRRCGFSSAAQFSRVFREQSGMSPSEARRYALAVRR
ncbi:helix-turn-helix domain-containing protein [Promicromonospora sp. MEB111]|uniref:helix-turn-helix domain-containing protein n=1 Tax=Promicromonospora sp. MEB111 TaxID=3040301 RepID=UPI00254E6C5B|nr:helix-turn-helix domain-containing protein [Promicromonospora sp. MEB111]